MARLGICCRRSPLDRRSGGGGGSPSPRVGLWVEVPPGRGSHGSCGNRGWRGRCSDRLVLWSCLGVLGWRSYVRGFHRRLSRGCCVLSNTHRQGFDSRLLSHRQLPLLSDLLGDKGDKDPRHLFVNFWLEVLHQLSQPTYPSHLRLLTVHHGRRVGSPVSGIRAPLSPLTTSVHTSVGSTDLMVFLRGLSECSFVLCSRRLDAWRSW